MVVSLHWLDDGLGGGLGSGLDGGQLGALDDAQVVLAVDWTIEWTVDSVVDWVGTCWCNGRRTGMAGQWTPSTPNQKRQLLKHQTTKNRRVSKRDINNIMEVISSHWLDDGKNDELVDGLDGEALRIGRMIGWILKPEESVIGASTRSKHGHNVVLNSPSTSSLI